MDACRHRLSSIPQLRVARQPPPREVYTIALSLAFLARLRTTRAPRAAGYWLLLTPRLPRLGGPLRGPAGPACPECCFLYPESRRRWCSQSLYEVGARAWFPDHALHGGVLSIPPSPLLSMLIAARSNGMLLWCLDGMDDDGSHCARHPAYSVLCTSGSHCTGPPQHALAGLPSFHRPT